MPTILKNKNKNCDINIMIRGIGGQGVKLAGSIIGQAATFDNRHAVQSMKYGSAITGGETRSEIKVSTEKIIYPRITEIDVYVAFTQDDLEKYFDSYMYIVDVSVAKNIPEPIKDKILIVDIMQTAEGVGSLKSANMVLIGILNQLFNLATDESMIKAIRYLAPGRFIEVNIAAYKAGKNLNLKETNSDTLLEYADFCRING